MATVESAVVSAAARRSDATARESVVDRGAWIFAACCFLLAAIAWGLAAWFPIGFSIAIVFLFAGPHNWMEGRYLLSRMPPRWGPLRAYFLTGIGGVVGLTIAFAALPWIAGAASFTSEHWLLALGVWNTALVVWLWGLAMLRSRQNPRRDWAWLTPLALALVALNWMWPQAWDLGLVYLHPLVALWFLDRELAVQRSSWRKPYRLLLATLPVMLAALWWTLADAPPLPGDDLLTARIAAHAGAGILDGVSSHLLVSTHTLLEMLHYGVWLVAIPLVSLQTRPWNLERAPLARKSLWWRRVVIGVLGVGVAVVVVFWIGFLSNYPLTRDIYFTVAMLHVLAEAPFLLRLL